MSQGILSCDIGYSFCLSFSWDKCHYASISESEAWSQMRSEQEDSVEMPYTLFLLFSL